MPKKRNYNFKQLQGASSSVANSGSSSSKNGSSTVGESGSVNERLGELRKIEGAEAAQVKRDLAEAVNQRTVPPHLRGILGVPESAPPKPKNGRRPVIARLAGPAPPESWTRARSFDLQSLVFRNRRRNFRKAYSHSHDRNRPEQPWRFARNTGFGLTLKDKDEQAPNSLLHISLKVAAQQWELFDEADYPALADVDLRLRVMLLSYIGHYGSAIGLKGFEALLQGNDAVQFLDLGGLLGHSTLTSTRLVKSVKSQSQQPIAIDQVAESWEEDSFEAALSAGLSTSRFTNLTYLCLSHPAPTVSWKDLLSLSKQVPKVTHLSVAYWPRPTLTPNLATATVSSGRSPDVMAGGSNYYSGHDRDYSEPASLLRQLSANLLYLQWLDLEGCTEWMPALATHDESSSQLRTADPWPQTPKFTNLFLESWKNVTYLNCFQGWLPAKSGVDALPRQSMPTLQRDVTLDFLKADISRSTSHDEGAEQLYEIAKRKAQVWLDLETHAVTAAGLINDIRRHHNLRPILMDHGWSRKRI